MPIKRRTSIGKWLVAVGLLLCSLPVSARTDSVRVSRWDTLPDVLFDVKVKTSNKQSTPPKDNFWRRMFAGHIDRTFERKFDYSLVVVPSWSREGSIGLGGMAAALYRLDRSDSSLAPSDVSISANASIKGFFYVGALGNTYFKGGRSRLKYELSFSQRKLNFWGISYDFCDVHPAINYTRWRVKADAFYDYMVYDGLYVGAALNIGYNAIVKIDDLSYLEGQKDAYLTTGIGLSLQYDTRNNISYPTKGWNVLFRQMVYPGVFGNCDRTLWRSTLTVDYYQRLWRGGVLAFDLYGELNSKDAPWALREEAGGIYRLRGYYSGRYIDNNIVSLQMEVRQKLFWRVGLAAFIGCGSVFPSFQEWRWSHLLPSGGVGLRFEFKHNLNLRVDYGFGRGTSGFVLSLGESF